MEVLPSQICRFRLLVLLLQSLFVDLHPPDFAMCRQGIYALGIAISLVYSYGLKIYPVAIPLTLELFFIMTLVALKVTYDRRSFEKIEELSQEGEGEDGGATELLSRPESASLAPADKVLKDVCYFPCVPPDERKPFCLLSWCLTVPISSS